MTARDRAPKCPVTSLKAKHERDLLEAKVCTGAGRLQYEWKQAFWKSERLGSKQPHLCRIWLVFQ